MEQSTIVRTYRSAVDSDVSNLKVFLNDATLRYAIPVAIEGVQVPLLGEATSK